MLRMMTALLLLLGTRLLPVNAQTLPPLRQYLSIRNASGATLSPDGGQVAFLTNMTGTAQVWRISERGGWPEQMTFFSSGVSSVRWSPTGENLLVAADTDGTEQYQFTLVNAEGTRFTSLTRDPKVRNLFGGWSRDGKSIFYAANARDPRYTDCYLMDVETGKARLVFQKDASLEASALSADGRYLAVTESDSNTNGNIYLVEMATGKGRLLTPHTGEASYGVIGFGGDGKTLYLTADEGREFVNLAQIDLSSGKLTYLQETPYDVNTARLSPDGRLLAYTLNREGYSDLVLLDTHSGKPVALPTLPRGTVTPLDFSRDGRRLALTINTPTQNTDVWLLDVPEKRLRQVTQSSRAGIDRSTFVAPTLIRYKTFDGREIPAFFYAPKTGGAGQKLPVILSVHGGPESQEPPIFNPIYQYYVSRGYAVLAPNIRGSRGYGKTYLNLDNGAKRWDALRDLNAAVDWIAAQPTLDGKKVAIAGGSYGGFAVLAMLVHYPDRFAAGVDTVGISDLKTFLANTSAYRRANRMAEYGDPAKDSDFMEAISPAGHVEKIAAPLMVVAGKNDPRVPYTEAEQIVAKVKAKGGVVEYLLFPDEGHGVAKLPNRIKYYEAVVAFLDKYVRQK